MDNQEKIKIYKALDTEKGHVDTFIDALDKTGDTKHDYEKYMTTAPINVGTETKRANVADYDTACALLTMFIRHEHYSEGSFARSEMAGQVKAVVDRMIFLLGSGDSKASASRDNMIGRETK